MLRISATTIESFHLYQTTDWMTEERFIEGLGKFKPTLKILRGLAFEKILQDPDRFLTPGYFEADGIAFPRDVVEPALERLPADLIWQAKTTKDYDVGETVTVVSKTDGQIGRSLLEIKTTEYFDLDKYRDSRQWRLYLDAFEADVCRYLVCEIRESKRDGELYLAGIHEWDEHPYEGMRADLLEDLSALVRFIHLRELERYFQPKEAQWFE